MKGLIVASAVVLALSAGAAQAGQLDTHGAAAIRAGDFAQAETILNAEMAGRWSSPETMLNLAHVYRHTGRGDLARVMYQRVLSEDNILLNASAERPLRSYDVARANLAQLGSGMTFAAR